ncbi:uncharacterized protein LOC144714036 [Wolffia australiana]
MVDRAQMGPPPTPLFKQKSWSPDSNREEMWERRKGLYRSRRKESDGSRLLSRSVTDEDLEELRGCIDLGFGFSFDSPASSTASSLDDVDRLSDTLPALDLYYAVQRSYSGPFPDSPSSGSPLDSPLSSIFPPGENPQLVKKRLKQWAQVVACTLRDHLQGPLQRVCKEDEDNDSDIAEDNGEAEKIDSADRSAPVKD